MEFKHALKEKQDDVEKLLIKYLPESNQYNQKVIDAMQYSLMAGGKRIRPILLSEVFQLLNGKNMNVGVYQVALEMIHTYSLIHDDLPAMDNDALRRGLPTCHIQFGEDIAILAGDALLNQAFEIMLKDVMKQNELLLVRVMSEIAEASGVQGMIGGQVADVLNEGKGMDQGCLDYIHLHKTAAIIRAAFAAGAILAKASEAAINDFRKIGNNIGLAFQIQDDLLDVLGDEKELGKPLHSDAKNNKTTYITLFGIDDSKARLNRLFSESLELLKKYTPDENTFLCKFIHYLQTRKS